MDHSEQCLARMQQFVDELIESGIEPETIITTLPKMAVYAARKDKDWTVTYLGRLAKAMRKAAEEEPVPPRPAGLSSYDP